MQKIVLPNVVKNELKHWAVEVGIHMVSKVQPKGFVAVDGDAGR